MADEDYESEEVEQKVTKLKQQSYSSPTLSRILSKHTRPNLSVDYTLYDDDTEESYSTTNHNEPSGEWIECQELVSGRHLFYNTISMEIVFDNNPLIIHKKKLKNIKNNAGGSDDDEDDMLAEDLTDNEIVQHILKFDKLKWDFNNDVVDIYRLQCNAINHTLMLPHPISMSFPEFFSTNTLPKKKHFVAQILPPKDNTLFPTTSKQWKVRVIVQETTAKQLIDKIVEKKLKTSLVSEYDGDNVVSSEFILKVVGCEEYILYDDTKLIVDYEAVRKAVRNEDDVVFQLDHRPDLPLIEQECFDKNIWHIMQFKNKYVNSKLLSDKIIHKHLEKESLKYCKFDYGDGMSLSEIMLAKKHNGFTKPYQLFQNQLILSSKTKFDDEGMSDMDEFDEYKTNLGIFLDDVPPPPPPTTTPTSPVTIDEPLPVIKHSFKTNITKTMSLRERSGEQDEESEDDDVPPPPPLPVIVDNNNNSNGHGHPKGSFTPTIIVEDVAAEIKIDDNKHIMNKFASQMKVLCGKEILQNIPSLKDTQFLLKSIPKKVEQIKAGLQIKEMLLHEFAQFYRVKMSFMTNVTHLPRYKHYISSMSSKNIRKLSIIVRHELWIGDLKYDTTTFDTDMKTKIGEGMRFKEACFAQSKQKWCDLARESCISFTVLLCDSSTETNTDNHHNKKKIKSDIPIAFVRFPIVDERNLLRDGKYALNLWPIPLYIAQYKGAKCDPYINLAFRYRGSTTDRHFKRIKKKLHSKIDKLTGNDLQDKSLQNIFKLGIEFEQRKFKIIAPPLNYRINYKSAHLKRQARELSRRETEMISLSHLSKEKMEKNKRKSSSFMRIFSKKDRERKEEENKEEEWRRVHEIVSSDLLYKYSQRDKQLLWKYRHDLCKMPNALNCFLSSIDWRDVDRRSETYDMMERWTASPYLEDSLELLSYEFMDNYVREYAIMRIAAMHDSDLQRYLLQLVQCLKYELHHNNALIRLLMRRSIANPNQIGHFFFWHMKSEYLQDDALNIMYLERFGLYLEEYLLFSQLGVPRDILLQCNLCRELGKINSKLRLKKKLNKKEITKADLKNFLHLELSKLNNILPNTFILPINPRWRCTSFMIDECKTMDSAQLPLWLSLKNIDDSSQNTIIMFKTGDDLRQDILTLQILRIMDKIWLDRGLNLRLLPYNVVSTGNGQGMVEIVLNSKTTTYIHTNYGGGAQKGARDITTHLKYIRDVNNNQIVCVNKARDIYSRSCAGYCIASYVMGLGDRHPSNIMVREKGELFHIDFSHFLGNFKSQNIIGDYVKWQREVAPFVFLPAYKYCINNGNKDESKYNEFVQFAVNAYLALRQRHRLLINLFILMLPSQMPELIQKKHIHYLRNQLHLNDVSNDCVYKHILKIIKVCLNDKRRIIDNTFHAVKHR